MGNFAEQAAGNDGERPGQAFGGAAFLDESGSDDCGGEASRTASGLRHGCIIMASGMGTRFGGNKLMAQLNGKPLIQYMIEAASGTRTPGAMRSQIEEAPRELFAQRVVVTRHAEVAKLCEALGVDAVLHSEPLRSDAVRLGMQAMRGCDTVTFFQGDQPLIAARTIAALLDAAERNPEFIWRASFHGTPGAPVLFPSWAFDELRMLPEGKGGGFVAKAHSARVRCVEVASKWELFDVDTPKDLHVLQTHLAQKSR